MEAIAGVLRQLQAGDATVFIDGLTRAAQRLVTLELDRQGRPTGKVSGRDGENDGPVRLADALWVSSARI